MFLFSLILGGFGVLAVIVGLSPAEAGDDAGPPTLGLGVALIVAAVLAFAYVVRDDEGARAGAWRQLDAQATISAVGGPSWEEFQATAEAESAAWELRAAQAVATAGAPGGGQ